MQPTDTSSQLHCYALKVVARPERQRLPQVREKQQCMAGQHGRSLSCLGCLARGAVWSQQPKPAPHAQQSKHASRSAALTAVHKSDVGTGGRCGHHIGEHAALEVAQRRLWVKLAAARSLGVVGQHGGVALRPQWQRRFAQRSAIEQLQKCKGGDWGVHAVAAA